MKKIVPFKKEIIFKTNLSEITSISLEHNLHIEDNNLITGNFMLSGEYKIADTSINTDKFNFELPFDINVDDKYIISNVNIDIDDFYYEIINNRSLEVNIDILIDKLEEKPLMEEKIVLDEKNNNEVSDILENEKVLDNDEDDYIVERCIEKENILKQIENDSEDKNIDFFNNLENSKKIEEVKSIEKINSLFDNLNSNSETYKTYKVCIIRNGDTIESIIQKYGVTKDELENYNNLSDIKIGDKLIIPAIKNEKI